MRDDSAEILFQSFLQEALVFVSSSVWYRQGCPLFDVVHSAFSPPIVASPTLQGALKDGFGEAVTAYDMPEPCKFPSLDSCQKRFLQTHKEADLALLPVVGLVLWRSFLRHLVSKAWITAIEEDGGDERLVQLELACAADSVALPYPVLSGYCCHLGST